MISQNKPIVVLAVLGGLYLLFCLPLLFVASDDIRMVNVFSIDESDIITHVWNLYVSGGDIRPSFKYGGVFYYMPVVCLYLWSIVGTVTEQITVVVVRLFCIVSGLGCLYLTYLLGRENFDEWVGVIAAFLLLVGATFLRWSVESHPDLPQLFFLLGSLLFVCRYVQHFEWRWVVGASLCAGLAFGTKYGGIFLLPVLMVALFLSLQKDAFIQGLKDWRRWLGCLLVLVLFIVAFAVTNPMAVMYPADFYVALASEKEVMGFGHRIAASSEPWTWLTALFSQVGQLHMLVLVASCVWGVYAGKRQAVRSDHMILIFWIVLFLGYLMVESQLKRPRHLLPVLPCVLLFVGAGYRVLWHRVQEYMGRWAWLSLLLVLVFSLGHIQTSADFFADRYKRENDRTEIAVGRWLAESYPPETTMVFDVYAYVPSLFQNVYRTIGMSYMLVNHYEPDLLVVRDAVMRDYNDPDEAPLSRQGPEVYLSRHYFYGYLEQGLIPAYQLERDFGTVAVYKRVMPVVRKEEDVRRRWRFLVKEDRQGRHYGLVAAYWTMGYIFESQGKLPEAQDQYQLARSLDNFGKRLYTHGALLLQSGHLEMARHAFAGALEAAESESLMYRAGMREDLAFRYFRAGFFQDMLDAAQSALRLSDNLPAAVFETAVATIALNRVDEGVVLFERGIERFGVHEKGKRLLTAMIAQQVRPDVAQKLVQRYYGEAR